MELFSTEIEKTLDRLDFVCLFFFWGWGGSAVDKGSGNQEFRFGTVDFSYLLDIHMVTLGRQLEIQLWIWKRCLG